jgi:broad specificity phosphatase PhoE
MSVITHLIRHGESAHNEYSNNHIDQAKVDPYFWDSGLSVLGEQQCRDLNSRIQQRNLVPDIVFVSPLTRAILTAKLAFSHLPDIKYIAHPLLTERIENACDIGTPATLLKSQWSSYPTVDFSLLDQEIWFPAPPQVTSENYRELFRELRWDESEESLQRRIDALKQWVIEQGYKNVAVVGHSAYFKLWLNAEEKMANCHIETTRLG